MKFSTFSRRPIALAILFLAVLTGTAAASAASAASGPPVDYLFPPPDLAWREPPVRSLPGRSLASGEVVEYTAFNGTRHLLTRFAGKNVAILLPGTWMGEGKLSPAQVRSFVDRTDILYEHFRELQEREPEGNGLLNVAVVPDGQTCGWGCGWIGSRGIEVADIGRLNPILWREIAADVPVGIVVHEMTHNFDVYSQFLYYLPGHAHAWTDFVNFLMYDFSRTGNADDPPDEVVRAWMEKAYLPYVRDPAASWAECVRDGLCESRGITANNAWGTTSLRVTELYGPRSARGFFRFLNGWMADHTPPSTPQAKEDLHVEALAAGAGANLGCFADFWRWRAGPALRDRMRNLYGAQNAFCADADQDGTTALAGDCDDTSAAIRPGAVEIGNGIDDDCDGVADEAVETEPAGGDFLPRWSVPLPAEIAGRIGDGDSDSFVPEVAGAARVRARICSGGFQGAVVSPLLTQFVGKGNCESMVHELRQPGSTFDVRLYYSPPLPGPYVLRLLPAESWPAPWAMPAAVEKRQGAFVFKAAALDPSAAARADEVRFWVDGLGFVGSVPYADSVSFSWVPGAGAAPGLYTYRTQLVAGGVPVSDLTSPSAPFELGGTCEAGPEALCLNRGRFRVLAHWRTPDGNNGAGRAMGLTSDAGWFWFFDPANIEVVVKVLDGCGVNNRYWVFASGLTNVEVTLTVVDARTGKSWTHTNPRDRAFQPVQDTNAFAACP